VIFIIPLVTVENKEGCLLSKLPLGSWSPAVRLYNFYVSLVKTNAIVIVINYITM